VLRSGWRTGLFAQDEWALSESLSATLGLRVDRNNVTGTALSPRAALVWRATGDLIVKTLFGRAHRAPNVYEHDYDDGVTLIANPALRGETINTLEFVTDYRVDRELAVRGSVYRWTMNGLVTQGIEPISGLVQYQSGESVTARGVELSADKTWPWGGRLRGSVSLQHAEFTSGIALENSPRALAKLNFSSPLGGTGLRLACELFHASARRDTTGGELSGYMVSNLTLLAERLAPGLEGSLTAYNLFDARYQHPGSRNNWQNGLEQDGRSLRAKLVYRY
jgi:outer membrane receptor protein involved in Fe transport